MSTAWNFGSVFDGFARAVLHGFGLGWFLGCCLLLGCCGGVWLPFYGSCGGWYNIVSYGLRAVLLVFLLWFAVMQV